MSVRRLVADALHLIDEHASAMPEGAYLELIVCMCPIYVRARVMPRLCLIACKTLKRA